MKIQKLKLFINDTRRSMVPPLFEYFDRRLERIVGERPYMPEQFQLANALPGAFNPSAGEGTPPGNKEARHRFSQDRQTANGEKPKQPSSPKSSETPIDTDTVKEISRNIPHIQEAFSKRFRRWLSEYTVLEYAIVFIATFSAIGIVVLLGLINR